MLHSAPRPWAARAVALDKIGNCIDGLDCSFSQIAAAGISGQEPSQSNPSKERGAFEPEATAAMRKLLTQPGGRFIARVSTRVGRELIATIILGLQAGVSLMRFA